MNVNGRGLKRTITKKSEEDDTVHRSKMLDLMDAVKKLSHWYINEEDFTGREECTRTNWRSHGYQTCNIIHETTIHRPRGLLQDFSVNYRGRGSFRISWMLENKNENDAFVFKAMRYGNLFDYKKRYQMENEAIIMERLTSSPWIVDIFGYCGFSILAENMVGEATKDIIPGSETDCNSCGYMQQEKLDELQKDDVVPMNKLSDEQRLDYAIAMAKAIAVIHGFVGGVILHGDIHTVQYLKAASGQIKLNDFNNAEIMDWNRGSGEYCLAFRCYGGTYRPPEELKCMDTDERVDVWAMGNNIYTILTGLWPFYQYGTSSSKATQEKIKGGEKPYVDPRYRNRTLIEAGLVEVMEQCWESDWTKRLTSFDVVKQLVELQRKTSVSA